MTTQNHLPETALSTTEVLSAADRLIAAFAATDTEGYFACFTPDADFVFHTEPERLLDRSAYERLWASWRADGWRVEGCRSMARRVRLLGESAIFVHDVDTTTSVGGTLKLSHERETIVFARQTDGQLLAVHEHLSPRPDDDTRQ